MNRSGGRCWNVQQGDDEDHRRESGSAQCEYDPGIVDGDDQPPESRKDHPATLPHDGIQGDGAHHVISFDEGREDGLASWPVQARHQGDQAGNADDMPGEDHLAGVQNGEQEQQRRGQRGREQQKVFLVEPVCECATKESHGDRRNASSSTQVAQHQGRARQFIDEPALGHDLQLGCADGRERTQPEDQELSMSECTEAAPNDIRLAQWEDFRGRSGFRCHPAVRAR